MLKIDSVQADHFPFASIISGQPVNVKKKRRGRWLLKNSLGSFRGKTATETKPNGINLRQVINQLSS